MTHRFSEANLLTFMQRLKTICANFGEMRKKIITTIIWSDKTKTLCVIEKLNDACFHNSFLEPIKTNKFTRGMIINGIDKETKKTSFVGNKVSVDMALENPALVFVLGNHRQVNIFFLENCDNNCCI